MLRFLKLGYSLQEWEEAGAGGAGFMVWYDDLDVSAAWAPRKSSSLGMNPWPLISWEEEEEEDFADAT